jgi:rSAM/selenodomain-associated transferase 2
VVVAAAEHRQISVIVPALNESAHISATLARLQPMRSRGHEVIVIDGGSIDATLSLAGPSADRVIISERGRARQMNAGAAIAAGDIYWFLHADTLAPVDADKRILAALGTAQCQWGRFDVTLPGSDMLLRLVARLMNLRSRLSGVATGDQGLFMTRSAFERIGGFENIPIMEDIAASRALKRISRPLALRTTLLTSDRRWYRHGIIRTISTMWALRLAYFLGVPPWRLARYYSSHS